MKMIEQWGTGIPRIISKCEEYGLPEPLFEEFGDSIKVTMFRQDKNAVIAGENAVIAEAIEKKKLTNKKAKDIEHVLAQLEKDSIFKRKEVEEILKCKRTKADEIIKKMLELNLIILEKSNQKGVYRKSI